MNISGWFMIIFVIMALIGSNIGKKLIQEQSIYLSRFYEIYIKLVIFLGSFYLLWQKWYVALGYFVVICLVIGLSFRYLYSLVENAMTRSLVLDLYEMWHMDLKDLEDQKVFLQEVMRRFEKRVEMVRKNGLVLKFRSKSLINTIREMQNDADSKFGGKQ